MNQKEYTLTATQFDIINSCLKDEAFQCKLTKKENKDPFLAAKEYLGFILGMDEYNIVDIEIIDEELKKIRYSVKEKVKNI